MFHKVYTRYNIIGIDSDCTLWSIKRDQYRIEEAPLWLLDYIISWLNKDNVENYTITDFQTMWEHYSIRYVSPNDGLRHYGKEEFYASISLYGQNFSQIAENIFATLQGYKYNIIEDMTYLICGEHDDYNGPVEYTPIEIYSDRVVFLFKTFNYADYKSMLVSFADYCHNKFPSIYKSVFKFDTLTFSEEHYIFLSIYFTDEIISKLELSKYPFPLKSQVFKLYKV